MWQYKVDSIEFGGINSQSDFIIDIPVPAAEQKTTPASIMR